MDMERILKACHFCGESYDIAKLNGASHRCELSVRDSTDSYSLNSKAV